MSLKKNAFSYAMWMIILLFAGVVFSFFGMIIANLFHINKFVAAIAFAAGFFVVLYLIYFLTGFIVELQALSKPTKYLKKMGPIAEKVMLILGVAAGFAIRVAMLSTAGEEAAYFEVSKVADSSGILVQSVQGSVYFYCMLLHGLFLLVGNHWIAGIWLQIVLQLIGSVIFYFAMKRLSEGWPAMIVFAIMLFAPSSVVAGLTYSPQMLYFCFFAIGMLLVSDYLHRSCEAEQYPQVGWCYAIIVGLVIGICCYIDVMGFVLFLPLLCLAMINRKTDKTVVWLLRSFLLVVSAVIAFGGMLFFDAILSGTTFFSVLNAWAVTYGSFESALAIVTEHNQVDFFVIMLLICLGVFSFWRRKKEERFTPFILLATGSCFLCLCGFTTDNMNGSYLLYVLLAALAVICVSELFYAQPVVVVQRVTTEGIEIIDLEKQDITQEGMVVNQQQEDQENKQEAKPRFIENPLPGPRKHVKKVMDYAFTPDNSRMYYDVQVSDADDFDL